MAGLTKNDAVVIKDNNWNYKFEFTKINIGDFPENVITIYNNKLKNINYVFLNTLCIIYPK